MAEREARRLARQAERRARRLAAEAAALTETGEEAEALSENGPETSAPEMAPAEGTAPEGAPETKPDTPPGATPETGSPVASLTDPGTGMTGAASPAAALLDRSRAAWEVGDWAALARLTGQPLERMTDDTGREAGRASGRDSARARLAALAAVGLAQQGDLDEARRYATLARDWGCPADLLARILMGGALNSLGRAASLMGEKEQALEYFEASIATVNPRADAALLGRTRAVAQQADLGLLTEAVGIIGPALRQGREAGRIGPAEAEVLGFQIELLNSALGLAQKRGQIGPGAGAGAGTDEDDLRTRSVSQLGQDLWVLERTNQMQGGFFVEFGATDGILLSNTFLLETGFGWRGICAEPNPAFFRKLRANRSCTVAPDCILDETGRTVDFVLADEFGSIAEHADSDDYATRRAAVRDRGDVIRLQTVSLDDFLKKYGAPHRIDYMSVDTEGSEYEILAAFPFDQWDVRLLTVEHNFSPLREKIRVLLEGHGYRRTEAQWDDWYEKIDG
ncbi:FkbM family methyltransferase [Chachezhania sediminis]|uniref:FkbM family methyltransferase n=1 Tax=Chachezhania sediminis TaxID=2599291 RepID=UPI00131D9599|nr:FkbM family methyltransferase [Chachezhania sediminis]